MIECSPKYLERFNYTLLYGDSNHAIAFDDKDIL